MGTHHHKLYTVYTASEGQYRKLADTIIRWCCRRKITVERFAEISGVDLDRLNRIMKPKPQFITVAEYSKIRSALNNQLPLQVLQKLTVEEPEAPTEVVETKPEWVERLEKISFEPSPPAAEEGPEVPSLHDELLQETVALVESYGLTKRAVSEWTGFSSSYLNQVLGGHKKNPNPKFFERLLELVTWEGGLPEDLRELATKGLDAPTQNELYPIVEEPIVPEIPTVELLSPTTWTVVARRYVEEQFIVHGATIHEALANFEKPASRECIESKAIGDEEVVRMIKNRAAAG